MTKVSPQKNFLKTSNYENVAEKLRKLNHGKLIFTNGCFDIIHAGHVSLLSACRQLAEDGGLVVVGMNSDKSVRRIKGPSRPVQDEMSRAEILSSIKYVDFVVVFDENTPHLLIKSLKPDLVVKGGDYKADEVVGRDVAPVVIVPLKKGHSTSKLIGKMKDE